MSNKIKYVLFVITSILLSCILMVALILGVDIYLHKKFSKVAGLNVWGYRGPVVNKKKPGEQRIVVLGGSTAFGYGVMTEDSFPAYLERKLNDQRLRTGQPPVSIVNLAYNNEGTYSFLYTLKDYYYLDYDIAIFYEGHNDSLPENTQVFRHQSPIFKVTGYMPIFPLIFREKAMSIRYGGNLESAYWGKKTVFRPNLAERATASALETAEKIARSLDHQFEHLTNKEIERTTTIIPGCGERWNYYCSRIKVAADYVLDQGKKVIIVTQPYIGDWHIDQQQNMVAMLQSQYVNQPRLIYVNLGQTIDLKDRILAYDGQHLTASGNERIAEALAPPLMKILK